MAKRISEELKKKILKSVEEDWLPVTKASKEYWVHHKTIYNWLNKNVEWNWSTIASYWEIKRLKRDKDDLLLIIWELTAEINLSKKSVLPLASPKHWSALKPSIRIKSTFFFIISNQYFLLIQKLLPLLLLIVFHDM